MTDLREAAQNVVDVWKLYGTAESLRGWMEILETALAEEALQRLTDVQQEMEQEPVAWRTFDGEGGYDYRTYEGNEDYAAEWAQRNPRYIGWVEPLYAAPPQRKPLTEEERNFCPRCGKRTNDIHTCTPLGDQQ